MTMSQLAIALQVPSNRISQICGGDRAISAETALRLARYWGTSPEFWLNLQKDYDLQIANDEYAERRSTVRDSRVYPSRLNRQGRKNQRGSGNSGPFLLAHIDALRLSGLNLRTRIFVA